MTCSLRQAYGPRHRRRGITLLECLLCMMILSGTVVLGLKALIICRSLSTRAMVLHTLSLKTNELLAESTLEPFDALTSGTTRRVVTAGEIGSESRTEIRARIERTITPLSPTLKEITVRAEWVGGKNPLDVSMSTRVARTSGGAP